MSSRKSSAPAGKGKGKSNPHLATLAKQLEAAILPGDAALETSEIDSIAGFLLDAADKRASFRSALKIQSDTKKRRLRIAIVERPSNVVMAAKIIHPGRLLRQTMAMPK